MSAADKTKSKKLLAQYERIRDLDARAKAWLAERAKNEGLAKPLPITAETWREMLEEKR